MTVILKIGTDVTHLVELKKDGTVLEVHQPTEISVTKFVVMESTTRHLSAMMETLMTVMVVIKTVTLKIIMIAMVDGLHSPILATIFAETVMIWDQMNAMMAILMLLMVVWMTAQLDQVGLAQEVITITQVFVLKFAVTNTITTMTLLTCSAMMVMMTIMMVALHPAH